MPVPRNSPEEWLAEEFGRHALRWAEDQGVATAVAVLIGRAAVSLSRATSTGHVCAQLRDIVSTLSVDTGLSISLDELRQALYESRLVGSSGAPGVMPFVLDSDDRFYLHRYFDYEQRLARNLVQRRSLRSDSPGGEGPPKEVAALLASLFPAVANAPTVDWQQVAVVTALLGRLTVVSGGPGTGKTTAIVNLLACLLEENPACRIALAAPTGKAAVRITEAIRLRAAHLPERIMALLPKKSSTVHRLLGVLPRGGFLHDAHNPLPIDVLVVDEASMLDLSLATHLIEAVPPRARIILVGDKDQLAAVESGAVFAELSADPRMSETRVSRLARLCAVEPGVLQSPQSSAVTGLADSVVWLRHNYRFGAASAIGRLAEEINAGDAGAVLARLGDEARLDDASRLGDASHPSLTWFEDATAKLSPPTIEALCAGYSHYVDACRRPLDDAPKLALALGHFRILCAVRDGHRGTVALNERVSAFFRRALRSSAETLARSEWYPGRPVVVLRNDYSLRLFNGDIGIAMPDAAGRLMVYFPDPESGFRAVAPVRMPEHETAFAMTVHKAQGSEFDDVMVVLPAAPNRVLTRELLYTGVTRARGRVTLVGGREVVDSAVRSATSRLSGLSTRLRDAENAVIQ